MRAVTFDLVFTKQERANQLIRPLTTCGYLGWKNCYSSCVKSMKHEPEGGEMREAAAAPPKVKCWGLSLLRTQTLRDCPLRYVELTSMGQGLLPVEIFFCFKAADLFRAIQDRAINVRTSASIWEAAEQYIYSFQSFRYVDQLPLSENVLLSVYYKSIKQRQHFHHK